LFLFPCQSLGVSWKVSKEMKCHKGYESFVFAFSSEYEYYNSRNFSCSEVPVSGRKKPAGLTQDLRLSEKIHRKTFIFLVRRRLDLKSLELYQKLDKSFFLKCLTRWRFALLSKVAICVWRYLVKRCALVICKLLCHLKKTKK